MSKHYKTNKKEYYINLRSNDARVTQLGSGSNGTNFLVYEWDVNLKQNLSREAKLGIANICSSLSNSTACFTIRCSQVKNDHYESGGNFGAIIYIDFGLKNPPYEKMYPLAVQNLDVITLHINSNVFVKDIGVPPFTGIFIQLKVVDYDTEEVRAELMPTYTKDSTAIHYKM